MEPVGNLTDMTSRTVTVFSGKPASSWRVVGTLYSTGIPAKLEWANGRLTGTADAIRDIDAQVASGTDTAITPTGPFIKSDKTDETSAFVMCLNAMRDTDVTGDPPEIEIPEIPDDAIA